MKKVRKMAKVVRSEITSIKLAKVSGGYGNNAGNDGGLPGGGLGGGGEYGNEGGY